MSNSDAKRPEPSPNSLTEHDPPVDGDRSTKKVRLKPTNGQNLEAMDVAMEDTRVIPRFRQLNGGPSQGLASGSTSNQGCIGQLGAGKPQFRRIIKEMASQYRPNLMIIIEPRISRRKALKVIRQLGYPNLHRVDARGFAGGIWLLWDADQITVSILYNHPQFIHARIEKDNCSTLLTHVYGFPQPRWRQYLWQNLQALASSINEPWLLSGDFNAILSGQERLTRRRENGRADKAFVDCVNNTALIDLDFAGPHYTWKSGARQARLDRMLCNKLWRLKYPEAAIFHLPRL
ncbi:hypothetical protein Tsubulata_019141 [Turnera subulata]|uniref:Endonuclease/exonuclease/phosphatase domain-containing protein n=1 Tax=Turnera subulata TaxID=218843 RepID=A0A9Q0G6H4_9ROSI|nr:hypothetical protein Tsubulata_019141 [Turnera subulata]